MQAALRLGRRNFDARTTPSSRKPLTALKRLQFAALDRLIRARFGGNLRHGFVAAVLNFLDDVGIPICEGYGLTETSPIISINTPYRRRPGYVGRMIPGVEVVVLGEGRRLLVWHRMGNQDCKCAVGGGIAAGAGIVDCLWPSLSIGQRASVDFSLI